MDDNQGEKTNPHTRKGKSGQHKRYYRGTRPKPRGKRQKKTVPLDLAGKEGQPVLFRREDKFWLGWFESKVCDGEYLVNSLKLEDGNGCKCVVNADHHPVLLSDVIISDMEKGTQVMFTWDSVPGEFLELRPAVFLCREGGKLWVKPNGVHALSVKDEEICLCPYEVDMDDLGENMCSVAQGDINVVNMVVSKYENALKETQLVFDSTKTQLLKTNLEKRAMEKRLSTLDSLFEKSLCTISELKAELFLHDKNKVEHSTRVRGLLELIACQNDSLNMYQHKILASNNDIISLKSTVNKMDHEKDQLLHTLKINREERLRAEKERDELAQQVEHLQEKNNQLASENAALRTKQTIQLEQRQSTSAGHPVIVARPAGTKSKPQTLVPIRLPQAPSSSATSKTLEGRARELMKMCQMISSKESPTSEDVIATLASFFRKFPSLASDACRKADLSLRKELTAGETLDLKVLLRLPMRKFRQLRTLLSNHGVRIFSSDRHVYRELRGRRDVSEKTIELGELPMKKTVGSSAPTDVAYIRIRDLTSHIENLIGSHMETGDVWDSTNFRGEVWVKILGDKGGSSTKLACQICNFNQSNSADKTDILALYNATDSYNNMATIFSPLKQQILQLQRNSQLRVGGTNKICRVFLAGDYEFLTKVMGHMGPNASYPCLWCYIPLSALAAGGDVHSPKIRDEAGEGWMDNPSWYKRREPDEIVQDLADNKADPRRGGNTKANGPYHNSISSEPILPIIHDLMHIAPPILHIMLGLVVRFYRNIECLCRDKDQGDLGAMDDKLNDKWQELSIEAEMGEREHSQAVKDLKYEERLLEGFRKVRRGRRGRGESDPCDFPACAVAVMEGVVEGDVEWIQCDECGNGQEKGWFHKDCVRLKDVDIGEEKYTCPVCKGDVESVEDVVWKQEIVVDKLKERVGQIKMGWDKSKGALQKIHEEVKSKMGPLEKRLGEVLENELGVKKQAYHSQCFVGNHCKIILNQSEKLIDVLDGFEEQGAYTELFSRLRDIFHITGKGGFLSFTEVDELCTKCWDLGRWFPQTFPKERIPPKLHFLLCHVPECAKMWNTVGLLSEQGIESLHAQLNADERTFGSVRDEPSRIKLVFQHHGQRMLADKVKLNTVKRKCSEEGCSGRYKAVEGKRICQVCGKAAK